MKRYTHTLQYEQPDGSWRDGYFAYTLSEAKGVAREGRKRTGRKVRVVRLRDDRWDTRAHTAQPPRSISESDRADTPGNRGEVSPMRVHRYPNGERARQRAQHRERRLLAELHRAKTRHHSELRPGVARSAPADERTQHDN